MKRIFIAFIVFFAVFAVKGLYAATSCVPGKFLNSGFCSNCNPGYYCEGGDITHQPLPCGSGYFCPIRSTTSQGYPVDAATGCGIDGYGECPCQAGYFCPSTSATGTGQPVEPIVGGVTGCGTDGHGDCACTGGFYCPPTSTTNHGQPILPSTLSRIIDGNPIDITCTGGGLTECICPAGTMCPSGSPDAPINCPIGTYQVRTQDVNCRNCNSGYYCPNVGSSQKIPCTAGSYCVATGSLYEVSGTCSPGYFCPETSQTEQGYPYVMATGCGLNGYDACACPAGTYNSLPGQDALDDCIACNPTPGSAEYCPGTARTTHPTCEMGYYCPSVTQDHQICPAGYYCPTIGATELVITNICRAGYFCPPASTTDQGKPSSNPTTGCNTGGIGICPCSDGYYCPIGSQAIDGHPLADATVQNNIGTSHTCNENSSCDCPTGNMCPFNAFGTAAPTACTPGTYQDEEAQTSCISCYPGFICPYSEMSAPGSCPSQTTSEEGATEISDCYIDTVATVFIDNNGATAGLTMNQIIGDVTVVPGISEANRCYYNELP